MRKLLAQHFLQHVETQVLSPGELERTFERIAAREIDPYTAADEILARVVARPAGPGNLQ